MCEPHWMKTYPCFEFKQFLPTAIISPGNTCGINFGTAEFLLVNASSE